MNWDILLAALIAVESGGDPTAIGDEGKALGILQIHKCVVDDVNKTYNTTFRHEWLRSNSDGTTTLDAIVFSKQVCVKYLAYWGARYEGETGQEPTYEVYARIWNGGPRGYAKSSTVAYWKKVEREIENELKR
jgi:hypothetical protein